MTKRISDRDWQDLSAYLDNQLPKGQAYRLEQRLHERPELRAALDELRKTQILLRNQPRLRPRRNFTLTPQMVGNRQFQTNPLFPVFSFTSAIASLLLVIVLVGDLFFGGLSPRGLQVQAPAVPDETVLGVESQALYTTPPVSNEVVLEVEMQAIYPTPEEAVTQLAAAPEASPEILAEKIVTEDSTPMVDPMALSSRGVGDTGYPPPVEEPAMLFAEPETSTPAPSEIEMSIVATDTLTPLPTMTPSIEVTAEVTAVTEVEPVPTRESQPVPAVLRSDWRVLEVALALFALATGVLAVFTRRISR